MFYCGIDLSARDSHLRVVAAWELNGLWGLPSPASNRAGPVAFDWETASTSFAALALAALVSRD